MFNPFHNQDSKHSFSCNFDDHYIISHRIQDASVQHEWMAHSSSNKLDHHFQWEHQNQEQHQHAHEVNPQQLFKQHQGQEETSVQKMKIARQSQQQKIMNFMGKDQSQLDQFYRKLSSDGGCMSPTKAKKIKKRNK